MAEEATSSLAQLCSVHFASLIGHGRVPPIDSWLPIHVGDGIFTAMKQSALLNESSLRAFAKTPLNISEFDISGKKLFSVETLRLLGKYKNLSSLNLSNAITPSWVTINGSPKQCIDLHDIVNVLSDESRKKLQKLDVSGSGEYPVIGFEALRELPKLHSLSLAFRSFHHDALNSFSRSLSLCTPHLQMLDVSETDISDIGWLKAFRNLEVLIMHNVKVRSGSVHGPLMSLSKLRVLDVSKKVVDFAGDTSQESHVDLALSFVHVLRVAELCPWPLLQFIDLAGNQLAGIGLDHAIGIVNEIIIGCPDLRRVSVIDTPLDSHRYVVPQGRDVEVINCATMQGAVQALTIYSNTDRDSFTTHALHTVYYSLQSSYDNLRDCEVIECAKLVCHSMGKHLANLQVQLAGSACLYHLCKLKRIRRLPPKLVQNCMNRCLDAAELYRHMVQLQKNVWLTICNDYLLQLPGVDFYRTCKVALESMISNRDLSVARMTIAIVSIVTPKMKPPEAKELTGDERYVRHLVKLLNDNIKRLRDTPRPPAENSLFTLKFTLSALWNLTDDSMYTCEVFHESGGVDTCFEILESFPKHLNIQTKVLGILNNVAEVPSLKMILLQKENWITTICSCLYGEFKARDDSGRNRSVERSYFAAGVLSNLLASREWIEDPDLCTVNFVNDLLIRAIRAWPQLQGAMVSYRSFTPFARILKETDYTGAHMWCLWGVQHVLTHKDKNSNMCYLTMLRESEIPHLCSSIKRSGKSHPFVRHLATQIAESCLSNFHSSS